MREQTAKIILNGLLDRYERSRLFREGSSSQRIFLRPMKERPFSDWMNQADRKQTFLETLQELKRRGLIDFEWVRFEQGNLVERIWLITEEAALQNCYALAERVSKEEKLRVFAQMIWEALAAMPEGDIASFLAGQMSILTEKKRIPRYFFPEDMDGLRNRRLLEFLRFLAETGEKSGEEYQIRVVSQQLFGDSKYFERELRSAVLSVLRQIAKNVGIEEDIPDDDTLLAERGLVKWPEWIEFTGALTVELDDGEILSFREHRFGAAVNAQTIHHIKCVRAENIRVVTSIENKANYVWYCTHAKRPDELVLYHGGFFSPTKGQWLRAVYRAVSEAAPDVVFRHWGDIDLGGFRMFRRLRNEIFPEVIPYRMDRETLMTYEDRCGKIEQQRYLDALEALLTQDDYELFHETIRYMLEKQIRLEQEALIWM